MALGGQRLLRPCTQSFRRIVIVIHVGLRVSLRRRAAPQQPAIVEKGRPASPALRDERLDPRRGAGVLIALQNLGGDPRAFVLILRGEHRGPVHTGRL